MFIIIPFLLVAGSLMGILVIVYRKIPHLKKLTSEASPIESNIIEDFFPELLTWFDSIKLKNYKQLSLMELEKILRRLRVVTLKIDHTSDALIKKIRRVNLTNHLEKAVIEASVVLPKVIEPAPVVAKPSAEEIMNELKAQEQKLIIEIAKNPKDPQLYETLGDLYLKMNSAQDARESYEAALELNPHDTSLAKKYSRLIQRSGVTA